MYEYSPGKIEFIQLSVPFPFAKIGVISVCVISVPCGIVLEKLNSYKKLTAAEQVEMEMLVEMEMHVISVPCGIE
jgi:hypothetical protein